MNLWNSLYDFFKSLNWVALIVPFIEIFSFIIALSSCCSPYLKHQWFDTIWLDLILCSFLEPQYQWWTHHYTSCLLLDCNKNISPGSSIPSSEAASMRSTLVLPRVPSSYAGILAKIHLWCFFPWWCFYPRTQAKWFESPHFLKNHCFNDWGLLRPPLGSLMACFIFGYISFYFEWWFCGREVWRFESESERGFWEDEKDF